jgi:hypothetical protein
MRFFVTRLVLSAIPAVLLCGAAAAQGVTPVSGYEIYLGRNCMIGEEAGTCGTTFTGWTGIKPAGGWLPFPGSGKGVWSLQINYTGQPAFGGDTPQVTVKSGSYSFLFFNGIFKHGSVLSGSVTWPIDDSHSVPSTICGTGEAFAQATITVPGGQSAIVGCLHDLPAGTVIPPTVWGAFDF